MTDYRKLYEDLVKEVWKLRDSQIRFEKWKTAQDRDNKKRREHKVDAVVEKEYKRITSTQQNMF